MGGILGRRGQDDTIMEEHDIRPIDMLLSIFILGLITVLVPITH